MTRYCRQDVLRILRIHARQLRAWERAGLVASSELYTFQDLVQLRKLRDLRATRLSVASIRASISAMRSVSGMVNPLLEAGVIRAGSHVAFRYSGAMMDPIARQFVFDFESANEDRLAKVRESSSALAAREGRLQELFFAAIRNEEASQLKEASALYEQILEIDPDHAPACINLGTIHYNQRHYSRAEYLYRRATEADPGYALAFFDLGNVLDELQRLPDAIQAYCGAIRVAPGYADAHYNLALAYERTGERRKALRHWTTYIKLDPIGPWANHARCQARKILERESLTIVHRNGRALSPKTRATSFRPSVLPTA
ncbi:MAG TPA: tetratricopeptide repeat protein [Acidisarcina sp.]|nr:tetratricopeptide repeat protein [Acidisarcina sp.]